jgi:type IV secretion system protein TrbL
MIPDISAMLGHAFDPFINQWLAAVLRFSMGIFWTLATASFAFCVYKAVLEGQDFAHVLVSICFKSLVIGFWYGLLLHGPEVVRAIVLSFQQIGQTASGVDAASPGDILGVGWNIIGAMFSWSNARAFLTNPAAALALTLSTMATAVCFILMAITYTVTLIEGHVVLVGGPIFLALSGSQWTLPWAEKYLSLAVSTGVKLMLFHFLMGGVGNYSTGLFRMATRIGEVENPAQWACAIMAGSVGAMFVFWHIPKMFQNMMAGSLHLGHGEVFRTAAGVASAAFFMSHMGAGAAAGGASGGAAAPAAGGASSGAAPSMSAASSGIPREVAPPAAAAAGGRG